MDSRSWVPNARVWPQSCKDLFLRLALVASSFALSVTPAATQTAFDRVEFTQGIQVLQSVAELQKNLEGASHQPPVVLVAKRKAVMRIYGLPKAGNLLAVSVTLPDGSEVVRKQVYPRSCSTAAQRM